MIKNQKPIDVEVNIKYICPNNKCGYDHWISLKEAQTKNFKIVCDCSTVFSPKPIQKISIKYKKRTQKTSVSNDQPVVVEHNIPPNLLEKSSRVMQTFGFREKEANQLLTEFYRTNPISDYKQLVQSTLAINGG